MESRVLIVSPVRNEAAHIERVVRAVAAQEVTPARWIVVDDGSTDGTLELLRGLAAQVPFLHLMQAPPETSRGGGRDRLAQAAEVRSFNAGLATTDWHGYSHVMKLDGDIELPSHYLRVLLERFAADERLGLAGGVLVEPTAEGGMKRILIPQHHVHGAVKCYSRACFTALGGVQERLGWDTIDATYARMRGFATVSFRDLVSVHHRPYATADGVLRGRARHGECAYISHYPLGWVMLRSLKVARSRPRGISGVTFLFGYVRAAVRRTQRVPDDAYRRFTRRELRQRMLHTISPAGLRRLTAPSVGRR